MKESLANFGFLTYVEGGGIRLNLRGSSDSTENPKCGYHTERGGGWGSGTRRFEFKTLMKGVQEKSQWGYGVHRGGKRERKQNKMQE